MKERIDLFGEDGHLTKAAFSALAGDEGLGELERLEITEHLSFCDDCLLSYTQFLEEGTLLEGPQEGLRQPVFARLRERMRRLFVNKFVTVAAAVCITMALWLTGVFKMEIPLAGKENTPDPTVSPNKLTQLTDKIADGINGFFDQFDLGGLFTHEKE